MLFLHYKMTIIKKSIVLYDGLDQLKLNQYQGLTSG